MYMSINRVLQPLAGLIPLFLAATVLAQPPKNLDEPQPLRCARAGEPRITSAQFRVIAGCSVVETAPGLLLQGYLKQLR